MVSVKATLLLTCACCISGSTFSVGNQASATHGAPSGPAAANELAHAEALFRDGRFDQAKDSVQQFLKAHGSSVEGYNLLGIICSNQQDYDCSFAAFQHALKLDPSATKTRNNLGDLYAASGKADLAEKEFR